MSNRTNVLGVDLGFVQTKVASSVEQLSIFSSVTQRRTSTAINLGAGDLSGDSAGYIVGIGGELWNVGVKGTYDFTGDRLSRDSDLPKLMCAFGISGKQTVGYLVTGLPIDEFNTYKTTLAEKMQGTFNYSLGNKKMNTTVNEVLVIPQSAGAYFDYTLDDLGQVRDNPVTQQTVLVLDIGGRTSDGCIMEAGRYSQDSFTITAGVWKIHNELRKLIMQAYHFKLKPYEVDKVARTGQLSNGAEYIDVSDLVESAVETAFVELRDEMSLYIDNFKRFSAVLLAGGGSYLYYNLLNNMLKSQNVPVIILPEAEYANARGYYKYGLLRTSIRA